MLPPDSNNWLIRKTANGQFTLHSEVPHQKADCRFGYISYPATAETLSTPKLFSGASSPFSFEQKKSATGNISGFRNPSKEKYIESVNKLLRHIQRGDIYEINYCVEFFAEDCDIDPFNTFLKLDAISHAPHACLARYEDTFVICSSPERFLKKAGANLITQPIKGTAGRDTDPQKDAAIKKLLENSLKDRTENVMAVDVARHDLSRIAEKGTVTVEELCKVYSFEQVHQMISTVNCEVKDGISFEEIIQATFPMASMTGAPKIRAMQLIDDYEDFQRAFYSGSIGVIDDYGNFDFNVVIRSIIYDSKKRRISFAVGSAITAMSDPEEEWNECMLKAKAMISVLT